MKQLEIEILRWFVTRLAEDDPIRSQLCQAEVSAREFTSGGGAFLTLQSVGLKPSEQSGAPTYIDGPEIRAPEIPSGALVAYFSPSWTAFQPDGGRYFSVIVDGVSV